MLKKFISTFITAIVLILCALIIFRCCMAADHSVMADIVPDEALRQAYAAGELTAFTTKNEAEDISTDGYFSVYGFVYFPELNRVQVTVRYNRSLFNYTDMPEGTEFSYTLGYENDDNRISPTSVDSYEKGIYLYRRLVFDNVTVSDEKDLYCYMQITEEYESKHAVRYALQPLENRKFTKEEIRALKGGE